MIAASDALIRVRDGNERFVAGLKSIDSVSTRPAEHVGIAMLVVLLSHLIGAWVSIVFA